MTRLYPAVAPLRILLALLFVALVANQVLVLPEALDRMVEEESDLAGLRAELLVSSIIGLLCVQVVVACIWKLLGLVTSDRIFSDGSLVWVDVILGAIAAAWLLLLAIFASLVVNIGFQGMPSVLLLLLLAGAVLGLLMVVMRALLRQATTLRSEMELVL